jgi:4-carboxymuconolactone decarboxylase
MNTPDHSALEKLLDSSGDFGTFGRYDETPVADMSPEMRDAFDFTKNLRGLVPGPHKIWVANPELSKTIVPTGAYFQSASTLSKAEIEIATCVICGHWRAAYSSFEHEKIGVHLGHLDPAKCAALVAGLQSVHSRS